MTVLSRVNCAENAVNIPIKQINESEQNERKESSELYIHIYNRSVAVLYICCTFGRWFSCPTHNSIASACVASAACPTSKVCVQCVFLRVEVCVFVCLCCAVYYQTMCQLTLYLAWGDVVGVGGVLCVRGSRRKVATGSGTTMPIIADATNSTNDEPPAKCCKYCEGMPRTYLHTTQTFCIYTYI